MFDVLAELADDVVESGTWPHGRSGQRWVWIVVTANIHGLPLTVEKILKNGLLCSCKFIRKRFKQFSQITIFCLVSHSLSPPHGDVEMTSPII